MPMPPGIVHVERLPGKRPTIKRFCGDNCFTAYWSAQRTARIQAEVDAWLRSRQ
jgi:hypothetical protein